MLINVRKVNHASTRRPAPAVLQLIFLAMILPLSAASADQPALANSMSPSPPTQAVAIDPLTPLDYPTSTPTEGLAMTVDAEGHARVFCADPADSLAPAAMRDAIRSDISRLRYE